jgi:hypothetical protein
MADDASLPPPLRRRALQLRVSLLHAKPEVWRRFLVPAEWSLLQLHDGLQAVMGWDGSHMFEFCSAADGYTRLPLPSPDGRHRETDDDEDDFLGTVLDPEAERARLAAAAPLEPQFGVERRVLYRYDFGDDWDHMVKLEATLDVECELPVCLDGRNACPPEDVGGVDGFRHFCRVMARPTHRDHKHLMEWHGGPYDPKVFDACDVVFSRMQ